jgi:hypothetical protein
VVDRSHGGPQFFRDAYGRDRPFAAALDRPFRDSSPEVRLKW